MALVRRFGDFPLAYPMAVEPYLQAFGYGDGAIAYTQEAGFTFALGDPVAAPASTGPVLDAFVDRFRDPVFVASQRPTAAHLAARGYRVTVFGHDSVIQLRDFDFSGGAHKRIRYASSWLRARGGTIVEHSAAGISKQEIARLSRDWKASRVSSRELRFLSRSFSWKPEPETRRFYAMSAEGKPLGLVGFDPIYEDGAIIGYLASQKRRQADDTAYLDLAIMRQAIETFRDEGRRTVHLGISPLAGIEPSGFRETAWLRRSLLKAHGSDWVNTRIFNSRGLSTYKSRFRGAPLPLYLCLPPSGTGILRMAALLVLLRVV